jgi:hypothetical protein
MIDWPKTELVEELADLAKKSRPGSSGRGPLTWLESECPHLLAVVPRSLLREDNTTQRASVIRHALKHIVANPDRQRADAVHAAGDLLGLSELSDEKIKEVLRQFGRRVTDRQKVIRHGREVRQILAARYGGLTSIQGVKDNEEGWMGELVDQLYDYLDALEREHAEQVSTSSDVRPATIEAANIAAPAEPGNVHPLTVNPLRRPWLDRLMESWQIGIVGLVIGAVVAVLITYPLSSRDNGSPETYQPLGELAPLSPKPPPSSVPSSKFDNTGTWGPQDRPTFTVESPPRYAVFNSIINSAYGDERAFIGCKDKAQPDDRLVSNIAAEDGHPYVCRVAVNNDVADNLDNGNPTAWLHDVRLTVALPGEFIYNTGVQATLTASNAKAVWATCNFIAPRRMRLLYTLDSARLFTNGTSNEGLRFSGDPAILVAPGVLLGYDKLDGVIRHSGQYTAFVWFEISVVFDRG